MEGMGEAALMNRDGLRDLCRLTDIGRSRYDRLSLLVREEQFNLAGAADGGAMVAQVETGAPDKDAGRGHGCSFPEFIEKINIVRDSRGAMVPDEQTTACSRTAAGAAGTWV